MHSLPESVFEAMMAEKQRKDEYVLVSSIIQALIPVLYGIATFVWTSNIWLSTNNVHDAALRFPGAPRSWGVLFLTLGLVSIFCIVFNKRAGQVAASGLLAIVFGMFGWTVVLAYDAFPRTVVQAIIYFGLSLLFLNRSRLAWTIG